MGRVGIEHGVSEQVDRFGIVCGASEPVNRVGIEHGVSEQVDRFGIVHGA